MKIFSQHRVWGSTVMLCSYLAVSSAPLFSQAQDPFLNLIFAAPKDVMEANFTGEAAKYIEYDPCIPENAKYATVGLDKVTAPLFRAIAPMRIKATYDSLVDVNSLLHKRIMKLKGLSMQRVEIVDIFLIDDRTGLSETESCFCDSPFGELRGAWPCATNIRYGNGSTGYFGYMYLGELAAEEIINSSAGGYWDWHQTILHEFSHTQFTTEYDDAGDEVTNKWGRDGLGVSYGGDDGHWGSELMGDQQTALDEGLASYWGMKDNHADVTFLLNWLNTGESRFLLGSHSFLSGTSEMWNAPHEQLFSGAVPANKVITVVDKTVNPPSSWDIELDALNWQPGSGYALRNYKWLDVPGEYIFYNERMFQAFMYLYHEFSFEYKDTAFTKIFAAASALAPPKERLRYPAHIANLLANSMEKYANTKAGKAEEVRSTLISSMFVYALYDIITHFGMDEADLKREFSINMKTYLPTPQPKAYTEYWKHRDTVKQIACAYLGGNDCISGTSAIDIQQAVQEVRDYFREPSRILK